MMSHAPAAMTAIACRSCSGTDHRRIDRNMPMMVPDPYPLSGDMALLLCKDCGFVGNHSPSTGDDYAAYYMSNNKHHARAGALHDLDEAYFEQLLDLVEAEGRIHWRQTDILDWGSGALLFSQVAKRRGARSVGNYDMGNAIPNTAHGVIASTHCIEHVLDFNAEFSRIHAALDRDGLFLIATPDIRGYEAIYWGPFAAFDLEHINHFDILTLGQALARAGFEIIAVREGERRVTPTLAYPEILMLARRVEGPAPKPALLSTRDAPAMVLDRYLARAERDLGAMVDTVYDRLGDHDARGEAVSVGFYGVASYAFRLLRTLKDRDFTRIEWIADSDARLAGSLLYGQAIKDLAGFSAWVDQCAQRGVRCLAFIAAVNAPRIRDFLQDRFGDRLDICVLPPDCQNREA